MKKSSRSAAALAVVEGKSDPALDGIRTVSADEYLEGRAGTLDRDTIVVNLCRSYSYLSKGYYVSLLADARGQRVYPTLEMIEEINNPFAYFRAMREAGLDTIDFKLLRGRKRLLPKIIVPEHGQATVLQHDKNEDQEGPRYHAMDLPYVEETVIFGRASERKFQRAARRIFAAYSFPSLKVRFYHEDQSWKVGQIFPVPFQQLEEQQRTLMAEQLTAARLRKADSPGPRNKPLSIACLFDPRDDFAPSDEVTLEKFERAALRKGALFETIGPDDLSRLPEFDALFIRTLTGTDVPSYVFAQRAASLGMPVIDDPESIARCSNKVYLHELFQREGIPTPETMIVSRRTPIENCLELGPPMIVKLPQGSFSTAVKKADNLDELRSILAEMFKKSPLLIVQEFKPTPFDWRIGVLNGRMLFAARYYQAKSHWQIASRAPGKSTQYGKVEAVPNDKVPPAVKKVALQSAKLIGQGLYGIDLKEVDGKPLMIEVNDNPNIETSYEDAAVKDKLYDTIIAHFLTRIRREALGSSAT